MIQIPVGIRSRVIMPYSVFKFGKCFVDRSIWFDYMFVWVLTSTAFNRNIIFAYSTFKIWKVCSPDPFDDFEMLFRGQKKWVDCAALKRAMLAIDQISRPTVRPRALQQYRNIACSSAVRKSACIHNDFVAEFIWNEVVRQRRDAELNSKRVFLKYEAIISWRIYQ